MADVRRGDVHVAGLVHGAGAPLLRAKLEFAAGQSRADGKFTYRIGATTLALFPNPEGTQAAQSIGFRVDRIEPTVAALKARGVRFVDYDLPGLRTVAHVCVLGAKKAAWFEDTEGNILCLHEDLQ